MNRKVVVIVAVLIAIVCLAGIYKVKLQGKENLLVTEDNNLQEKNEEVLAGDEENDSTKVTKEEYPIKATLINNIVTFKFAADNPPQMYSNLDFSNPYTINDLTGEVKDYFVGELKNDDDTYIYLLLLMADDTLHAVDVGNTSNGSTNGYKLNIEFTTDKLRDLDVIGFESSSDSEISAIQKDGTRMNITSMLVELQRRVTLMR